MNMVSFAKPATHDSDDPGGLIDKNLGVIYELQAAKRDSQNGMMKVDASSPIYRSIKGQVCVGECGDQASESLARRVGYMRR